MKSKLIVVASPIILLGIILSACQKPGPTLLEKGTWRGVFQTQSHAIPFNFIVEDDSAGRVRVSLTNAEEKTLLDSIRYERDSVVIPIDQYDAILIGKIEKDRLSGYLRRNQSGRQGIPFSATKGEAKRFALTTPEASSRNVAGTWSVNLINDKDEKRYTVGLLKQQGHILSGTILTTTGDYRYLEGVLDGDSIKLSGFGGSNPSLLIAKLDDSLRLTGSFISPGGQSRIIAVKSDTAKLPDPYSLTHLNAGYDRLSFSFPDINGKQVSLDDEKYKDKVVVVTIQGTWCPNCVDEAAFLAPWYKQNKDRGVEIIGLSFERKDDPTFARQRIEQFIKRFDINYDILFAGLADKKIAGEKLPALQAVLSFPTTILIDRSGKVRKIHTGFTGPATGKYYQDFIDHFNNDVNLLLSESTSKDATL